MLVFVYLDNHHYEYEGGRIKFKWNSEADMHRQAEIVMGLDPTKERDKRAAGEFRLAADRAIGEREAQLDRSMTREEKWKLMNELMLPAVRDPRIGTRVWRWSPVCWRAVTIRRR